MHLTLHAHLRKVKGISRCLHTCMCTPVKGEGYFRQKGKRMGVHEGWERAGGVGEVTCSLQ